VGTTRKNYDLEISRLEYGVLEMGRSVRAALSGAVEALGGRDGAHAASVRAGDAGINAAETAIHDECARLIAMEQPVARDLRIIMAMIKAALELERIGDYAVNIARAAERVASLPVPEACFRKALPEISSMAVLAARMLSEAVGSLLDGDLERAEAAARMDDEVDRLYAGFLRERIRGMAADPEGIDGVLALLFAAKHVERIADHAVNLCELAFYVENGENREL
jgi:phosphate transport system protein